MSALHDSTMKAESLGWREVESNTYPAGWPLLLLVGGCFLVLGLGFAAVEAAQWRGPRSWLVVAFLMLFAGVGAALLTIMLIRLVAPARIRHAADDVLADVPREPLLVEGAIAHGRLTHELVQEGSAWRFQPSDRNWRDIKRFLIGFGIPFSLVFVALVSWKFHREIGWPLAIMCAALAVLVTGGPVFLLMVLSYWTSYQRLPSLRIPAGNAPLEIDLPGELKIAQRELKAALTFGVADPRSWIQTTAPRESVRAVQLCPWSFSVGRRYREIGTWAVQGLLVLQADEGSGYRRVPLLLTQDFAGAARLMRQLADVLRVPYLFCADAKGWKEEIKRSKSRAPLQSGGTMS